MPYHSADDIKGIGVAGVRGVPTGITGAGFGGVGGRSGGDGLALDLQFAADKTLTARKGPTPVLTRGSSATFVGSNGLIQSAGNNVARFDHDPVTLESRGLLIEEGRTNSITYSENMTVANGWNEDLGAGTVAWSDNATTAPTGELTAEKLTEASTSSARRLTTKSAATVNGTTYILSVYAKASERSILQIGTSTGFVTATQNFDLSNGVLGTGGVAGASIVNVGSGWYRCSMQVVSNATGSSFFAFGIVPLANSARFTAYNGIIGYGIFLWGAQLEAGSFATSYIPTTTSALARSADVCSITGANFTGMWNALEGSLFTSAIFNAPVAYANAQSIIDVNDTTAANRLRIVKNGGTSFMSFSNTSASSQNVNIITATAQQPFSVSKSSVGFKVNDYVYYLNNSQVGADTLGAMIVSPTTFTIGDFSAAVGPRPINGTISSIRYYRKRLDNSKLASLTV
jgi:hypothetical protein